MKKDENWFHSEHDNRPFLQALFFERDGDLNLTFFLLLIYSLIGAGAVIKTVIFGTAHLAVQLASLSFLGTAFISLLIAAIPIAKAKILASSSLPAEVGKSISSVSVENVTTSTDIMELSQQNEIG